MDEIYPLVEESNNRSEFVQLYCNFYVETLLDELKEYINKPIPMQYKKYLTKLRNLSYNEIMKDETGKKICEKTIKKYEKIIKAEKINEVMNLNIDLECYVNIMKENSLKKSLNLFTQLLKSICFTNPPVLLQIYNNKDEIYDIITRNDDNNITIKGEDNDNGEEGEEEGGESEEEEETEEEDTDDERIELTHNSLNNNISYAYPHKRQSIYNTIPLSEDKLNIKVRKINPVTKELQIQNSNIHRLDEPHDSAEEVKWDDQSISSSYSNNNNNNKVFPSASKKTKKVKITKSNKSNNNTYGNGRVRFSEQEVENLMTGVKRFGVGKWKEILCCYEFNSKRTAVDLKDKYRNIQRMTSQR